ncbi:unnamed protein product [Chilo suppressalis]|uniref:Uncharacterized protein n=1 Tax=Chilo suppressalis TaxID=168631 RepID=A0ABN8BC26_CHISP|nr:unnamed protein product [Chilo suppressalis]
MSSEQEKLVQGDHAENDLTDSSNEESLKEIEQEHTESSTNRIVDDLDNDIEILDDGQDDDEDLHLEWDDDEIEDDIISINVPPLIEKSEEDRYVNKIDDPKGKVSEESINDIVTVDGINEKNTETTQMTEPLSPEESLQNIQSEINKICADIKDNIDQIDSIDEGESKIELNDSDELNKSKSPIEDLILIDDDDDELENIDNKMIDNKKSIDAVEIDDEEYNIGLNQTKTDVTTKDIVKGSKGLTDSKLITTEDNNDEIKVPSSNNQITKTTENVEDKTTDELIEAVKNIEAIIKKNDDLVVDDLIDNTSVIIKSEINEFVTGTIDIQVSETAKEMSKVNTNKLINFPETDSERDNFDLKKTTKCIDDDSDVSIELPDSKSIIIKKEDDIPVSEVTKHIEDTDFEKPVTEFERSNQILDKLTDDKTVGDLNEIIVTSSPNQSIDTSSLEANIDHGLNKPDMMLEIPTQEVIEFLDDTDVSMDFSKSSSNCSSEKRVDENGVLNVDILSDSAIVDPKSDVEKVVLDTAKKETVTEQSEAMEISHTEINQTEISSTINKELIDGGTKPDDKECEKAYSDLTVVANTVTSKRTNEKKGDDTLRTTNDGVHSPVLEEPDSTVPIISESNATTKIATKDKICTVNKEIYKLDNFNKDVSKIKKNSVPSVDETKPLTSQALDEVDNCYKDKSKIEKISVSTFDEPISSTSQTVVTESVDSKDELGSTIDKPIQSTSETIITKAIDSKELVSTIDEPKPSTSQADVTKAIDSKEIKSTIDEPKPSTSQAVIIEAIDSKKLVSTIDEPKPSTSRSKEELGFTIYKSKPSTSQVIVTEASIDSKELVSTIDEPKPSTSQAIITEVVDSKEELDEATDSLGLLAESSRVMEDDEDPDDEEEDDDDFDQDQDESSNQISAEHSEDSNSNAQTSENDQLKEQDEKESPQEDKGEFIFAINDVVTLSQEKEGDIEEKGGDKEVKGGDIEEKGGDIDEKEGDIEEKGGDILEKDDVDVDDVVCEDVVEVTPEQIGTEDNVENNVIVDNIGETETVIDKAPEEKEAMDIETVKLSDTSDNEVEADCSLLRSMLREQAKDEDPLPSTSEKTKKEPSEKTKPTAKRLFITKTSESVINFVDLEESSSEDDVQEVDKTQPDSAPTAEPSTSTDIQGALTAGSEPKTPTKVKRTPRINTSEISIRTVSSSEAAAQPQIKPVEEPSTPKFGLEVFNLDSDDEDTKSADETPPTQPSDKQTTDTERAKETVKCINLSCSSAGKCAFLPADAATVAYFDAAKKRRAMVCEQCAYIVVKRTESLVNGIKDFTPLLDLDTTKKCLELVEISDSESEEEAETENEAKEKIGVLGAKMLEQHLADMINKTWKKFKMDVRLTEAQDALNSELKMLEVESKEIDTLLNECQIATDKLRNDLYATFEHDRKELPAFTIYDTPSTKYSTVEPPEEYKPSSTDEKSVNKDWTRDETVALIKMYEQHRELWDTLIKDYYNNAIKRATLRNLAVDFNTSIGEIRRKLHSLRTHFRHELQRTRQRQKEGGSNKMLKSKWEYFELLKFTTAEHRPPSILDSLRPVKKWTRDETVSLIEKYEQYRYLWDTKSEDYNCRTMREAAFARLAVELNTSDTEISRKIQYLRVRHGKELRKIEEHKSKQGSNEIYKSSWEFFDMLNFITFEINAKRKLSSASETPAKRPAIPLPYAPIEDANAQDKNISSEISKLDDDKDIAVMQVSAESAPSELPAPGELNRSPLKAGMIVFGMRNILGSWARCRILEVQGQSSVPGSCHTFTIFKVRFDGKARNPVKLLPGRCLAYPDPAEVRLTIGTRVIALFRVTNDSKRETFYSGIVAEVPNPVNKYRYLVFFDDGYAQYVHHSDTRVVCECSSLVWEEVHPFSREFVREYLMAYPERPMVRLHVGQSLKTEWKCKWWSCRVRQVDASLVQVYFEEDNRTEWIYRGSTRLAPLYLELQAAERQRTRAMPRTKAHTINMPYVEYTRSDEQNKSAEQQASPQQQQQQQQQTSERETRQRAVAKKSTTPAPAPPPPAPVPIPDNVTSRVVYYTPKNAVKPYKMVAHVCGPQCKRTDVLALKDLRTYNPLAKPLLSGWERQIVRFKGHKEVMYRAPCGRRLRNMRELHRYLRAIQSDMPCDLFDFDNSTHCLAEFVLNTCLVGKKDLSHGKENVPVPCVNYYDESLPEFCSYNTERTPTAGVPLNLDPEFLCGCDCTDDCEDKSKCACWRMTLEGARTIGLDDTNVGYVYKRLPEPLPSGIYECNSRCKCKHTCLNRVAQHPLQLKLQVFKTLNRGWGIRALNDVPKGSFLCVYAGNLLTDATANMDGLNEGDEYLAELDYIEVVEQMKEGYEEDIPEADKKLDRKNSAKSDESESGELSSSAEEDSARDDQEDDDFQPGIGIGLGVAEFSKRLRKREKKKQKNAEAKQKEKEPASKAEDDCITISDDEEVREPSRFMAQPGMESSEFKSKYSSVRSYFGKDEACYIMDAKVQGNIGRYLNHSCQPNVFVQNVFVDTHDPRFPWVAFFALCHIKAGTELTWNYNYDVGSVPGKILYCYCGAPNCRGRLL